MIINSENRVRKIVITGSESTGKSILAKGLADIFNSICIPEFARDYVENLNRPYTYQDVEIIAKHQIILEDVVRKNYTGLVFYDTWLIITKIWFSEVYNKVPVWLNQNIELSNIDLFLVADNSFEWVSDKVRENKNNRDYLQSLYIKEIEKLNKPWKLIKGEGEERLKNAIDAVNQLCST